MMDTGRFEDLVRRSTKAEIFAPGKLWKNLGGHEGVRKATGDTFPTLLVHLQVEPPKLGPGTRWEFKDEHFGAHAFISYTAEQANATVRGVLALCMLDDACRKATEQLLETTRDQNGELGGLKASFIVALADIREVGGGKRQIGSMTHSGILSFNLWHLVNAYNLWRITKPEDRETLKDSRCPQCRGA